MELIFARSTLARLGNASAGDGGTGAALTAFGAGGVGGVWAGVVTVTEVVPAAAVDGTALGTLSVFAGAEAGAACFSFLSSTASERGRTRPEPSPLSPKNYLGYRIFNGILITRHVRSDSRRLCKNVFDEVVWEMGTTTARSGLPCLRQGSGAGAQNPTAPIRSPTKALCILYVPNEARKGCFASM